MPRRLPVKPDRFLGNLFILLVFMALIVVYYSVIIETLGPKLLTSIPAKLLTLIYHYFVAMLLWCLFQTIMGDPGQVPTFWGFHFGDHESKRKRYCLMCNVFKPERCHHCSTCNRCVLNMDHHCPWVNNCIGFWNRKQFVLLLVYVLICAYLSFPILTWELYNRLPVEYEKFSRETTNYIGFLPLAVTLFGWVITGAASYLMTNFLRFHIELILSNKTTIEFLEKKGEEFESQYCLSPKENWEQVFGSNKLLWFFPVSWASGHPMGDGIYWPLASDMLPSSHTSQQEGSQETKRHESENKALMNQHNSVKPDSSRYANSARNLSDNKENSYNPNINSDREKVQRPPLESRIDTVIKQKDANTLIVHSQDRNQTLKNSLMKK
ncbi:unnamed protein product [Moneuplotes crassus]|uniref:Palmitoyltransferase n=1 Tax=Euplotes crassus TaxID=5936 RepID=A0AAD1XHW6_EUPCR|nr:unnamed protein product [Moneuplotes crassus]